MESGYLYFIKDSFYDTYQHENLKPNKETGLQNEQHGRPCYYAFKEGDILWMVPVSSQISKYQNIYNKKTKNGKPCDTIVFGYVKGNKNAFLIQNMIPITEDYINNIYLDKNSGKPICLDDKLKKELNAKVRKMLRFTRNGISNFIFTPILDIEKRLLDNLQSCAEVAATSETK